MPEEHKKYYLKIPFSLDITDFISNFQNDIAVE